jgi:HTH-type transcriptional regulator/antitoxin HipB
MNDDMGVAMQIRTPKDLGAAIRSRRKKLGLDQAALAAKVGVSRQWVIDIEQGKSRAALGLVLQACQALGIVLSIDGPPSTEGAGVGIPSVDLDSVIARTRRGKS